MVEPIGMTGVKEKGLNGIGMLDGNKVRYESLETHFHELRLYQLAPV